jgi:Domain of unknown function (DUF6458)
MRDDRRWPAVTIGGSIALIIIGAILRYAVTWTPNGIDLQVVGLILIIGGVVGLIISLGFLLARRRRASSTQVYEERRYTEPPGRYNDPQGRYTDPQGRYTDPPA